MNRTAAVVSPLLVLAVAWAATPARAESGPYVLVFAGPNFLHADEYEIDADADGDRALGTIDPDYGVGLNLGGALGYRINDFFRVEAEVAYQHHGVDDGDGTGLAVVVDDLDGDVNILSAMVNGYVEAELGYPLKPFFGAGVGVARVSLSDLDGSVTLAPVLPVLPVATVEADVVDDDDTVLAGQAIAGVAFDVTEHWTTAFSYRFFAAVGAEFETEEVAGVIAPEEVESDFYSHALRFEVRYRF